VDIRLLDAENPVEVAAAGAVVQLGYFDLDDYPHDPHYDHEIGAVDERAGHSTIVVAVDDDGTVLGCATYLAEHHHPDAEHDDPDAATFRYFAVAPAAQGRGVGGQIVRWLIDRARADGKARLRIHTLTMMDGAMRLYERLGFERDPSHDEQWDDVVGLGYVFHLDR
jgi:GNAT superfamily N-acetyltransferase